MIITPLAIPVQAQDTNPRLDRLEKALVFQLQWQQKLVASLQARFGPDVISEELLKSMPETGNACESDLAQVEQHLKRGDKGAAARVYRDISGVTWDEAHAMVSRWDSCSKEQRQRAIILAKIGNLGQI